MRNAACGFDFPLHVAEATGEKCPEKSDTFTYLDFANLGIRRYEALTNNAGEFISYLECQFGIPINLIGTGPEKDDFVDRKLARAISNEDYWRDYGKSIGSRV